MMEADRANGRRPGIGHRAGIGPLPGVVAVVAFAALVAAGCASGATVAPSPSPAPTPTPGELARCPNDLEGNYELAVAHPRRLLVDGAQEIGLSTALMKARNGSWWADDAIPQFVSLDLGLPPLVVDRGAPLTFSGPDGLALVGGHAMLYPRAWFRERPGTLPEFLGGEPDPLRLEAGAGAAGTVLVWLPGASGSWVVELIPEWQTRCQEGDGVAYAIVDTR